LNSLTRYGLFAGRTERRRRPGRLKCGENLVELMGFLVWIETGSSLKLVFSCLL
jgi:hypothetical protein